MFLSVTQAVVGQFIGHGVPLFLRAAGQPSYVIGLVYLAAIPYVLRVAWSPLVDRYGFMSLGHYRSWLVFGQAVFVAFLVLLSFIPIDGLHLILLVLVFSLMLSLAMQDAATSALMVRGLAAEKRARGSAFRAVGAGLAGAIVGAGTIYLFADFGWQPVILTLAAISACGFCAVLCLKLDLGWSHDGPPPTYSLIFSVFRSQKARSLFVIKMFVGIGLALTYGFKAIVLIDAGLSTADAALVGLVLGNIAGLGAALAIRPFVDRFGGFAVLAAIGVTVSFYCLIFAVQFSDGLEPAETVIYVLIANALTFAALPPSRSILMGLCDKSKAATDFAAFVSLEGVVLLLCAGAGAALSDVVGIHVLLAIAALGSFVGAVFALRAATRNRISSEEFV